MRLQLDRAGLRPQPLPGIVVLFSRVRPIGELVAVHPGRDVGADRDHRHGENLAVTADQTASQMPVVDAAGAVSGGLAGIVVAAGVEDLRFVAVHKVAGNAAEEDAAVGQRGDRANVGLQNEVAIALLEFQSPRSAGGADRGTDDAPFRAGTFGPTRMVQHLPAREVLTVEDGLQPQWTDRELADCDALAQADRTASRADHAAGSRRACWTPETGPVSSVVSPSDIAQFDKAPPELIEDVVPIVFQLGS